jgi:hypothetical protein
LWNERGARKDQYSNSKNIISKQVQVRKSESVRQGDTKMMMTSVLKEPEALKPRRCRCRDRKVREILSCLFGTFVAHILSLSFSL